MTRKEREARSRGVVYKDPYKSDHSYPQRELVEPSRPSIYQYPRLASDPFNMGFGSYKQLG